MIIVVDVSGRTIGIRVDAVSDILTLQLDALQHPPELASDGSNGFVKALTIIEDRMVRVLDLATVLPPGDEVAA